MFFQRFGLIPRALTIVGIAVIAGAALILNSTAGPRSPIPDGWSDAEQNKTRILSRDGIYVRINPLDLLGGRQLEDWALEQIALTPPGVTQTASAQPKLDSSTGFWSIKRNILIDQQVGLSVMMICRGAGDAARSIEMYGSMDAFRRSPDVDVMAQFIEKRCVDSGSEELRLVETDEVDAVAAREPITYPPVSTDPLPQTAAPAGLRAIHAIVYTGLQANGFGFQDSTIATFEDGTYTSDLYTIYNGGIAASRAIHPESWGTWRMQAGELELNGASGNGFRSTQGEWSAGIAAADQRLNGCYEAAKPFGDSAPVRKGVPQAWCFTSDGRFTHSVATYKRDTTIAPGKAHPRISGRYRIDGYAARFVYDDGRDVKTSFAYLGDFNGNVSVNGDRYQMVGPTLN